MGKFGTAHTSPGDKLEADIARWSLDIFVVVLIQEVVPQAFDMRHGLKCLKVTSRVLTQNPDLNLKDDVEIVVGLDVVQSNHTGCIVGPIVSTGFPIADKDTEECSVVTCASFTWCSSPTF